VLTRLATATTAFVVTGLLAIPLLIGGNSPAGLAGCGTSADMPIILDTIRTLESGGRYSIPPNRGGASGAYQYIDSTWADYGGYASAYLAPPETQDARAALDVQRVLDRHGDIGAIPITWYWPRALDHPEDLDIVPMPKAGNTFTVRQYQTKWLALFEQKKSAAALATPTTTIASTVTTTAAEPSTSPTSVASTTSTVVTALSPGSCAGSGEVTVDGYALPIPKKIIDANPEMLNAPHHDYPALDLIIPEGTPVYAVRGGTVARVVSWPYNCWDIGRCDEPCGMGLSINADDGTRWIYCHGSRLNVTLGQQVSAGQLLMLSGNTGRSGTPHLHLELRVDHLRRHPGNLLREIWNVTSRP
jgi:Peptidase family M23/Transglycosylase-like domain